MNPFDQVVTGIVFIKVRDRFTLAVPFARTTSDCSREFFEGGGSEPEIVTPYGAKETGLLWHEPAYSCEQHRHAAREGFVSGQSARLGNDKIGCQDVSMEISEIAECPRPRILQTFNVAAELLIPSANDHDV